jgi:hypothetical protein
MTRFAIVSSTGNCLGFVRCCGPKGFEAYDGEEKSLGIFETEDGAMTTITQRISTTDVIKTSL